MLIVCFKPGHDGTIAAIEDQRLLFSWESEKGSFPRHEYITPTLMLKAFSHLQRVPDIVAVSGWVKGWHSSEKIAEAGYFGCEEENITTRESQLFHHRAKHFSSSHERSHILCAYGMSHFPQGQPCYALVWEGNIGSFYEIDEKARIHEIGKVMEDPGNKYSFLFGLADPTYPSLPGYFRFENAGRLMALASYAENKPETSDEKEAITFILSRSSILLSTPKCELSNSKYYNIGVESQSFKNLAGRLSESIFQKFYKFAEQRLLNRYPLLISGGCGLNCYWNSCWRDSGLFEDVFVPPCPNDTGSAIGTAIDAQLYYTGKAKISWTVYSGEPFEDSIEQLPGFELVPLDYERVARFLQENKVIAWVQGNYEIGPRALGNRSILASPFDPEMRNRLNKMKNREHYRPIAPVCLEEDVSIYFEWGGPSPYMLYFQLVRSGELGAITHVDCSARVQTVNESQNGPLYLLLSAFKRETGFGVLCNTSLNFKGKGFINSMSDLVDYARSHLDGFVVHDRFYIRNYSRK